jgi:hypothetical protein
MYGNNKKSKAAKGTGKGMPKTAVMAQQPLVVRETEYASAKGKVGKRISKPSSF